MSVSHRLLFALLIVAARDPVADQDWHHAVYNHLVRERIVGLLDLPEIVGDGCGPAQPVAASLYDRPSTARPPIGSLEMSRHPEAGCSLLVTRAGASVTEALLSAESGYEIPAAIVYERSGRWFRVALQRGSAWIHRNDSGAFHSYPALLKGRLSYLDAKWDGHLRSAPGRSAALKPLSAAWKPHLADAIPIQLLGTRRVGGEVWLHLRLETESCGEIVEGVTPVEGWVPAYRRSSDVAAWFYSRGC